MMNPKNDAFNPYIKNKMWCHIPWQYSYNNRRIKSWGYCDKLTDKQVDGLIKEAIKPYMNNFTYGVQSDGKGFKPYKEFDSCLDFCENKFT